MSSQQKGTREDKKNPEVLKIAEDWPEKQKQKRVTQTESSHSRLNQLGVVSQS